MAAPLGLNVFQKSASLLRERLRTADEMLTGRGQNLEKGHLCETWVRDLLRTMLPGRFGVGYGHIAWGDPPEGTLPLDVVIYDQLNYGAVYSEGDYVVVVPEAVAAVVEVKTELSAGNFNTGLKQLRTAFESSGMLRPGGRECPGFLMGIRKTPARIWTKAEDKINGPPMGYVDIEANRSRIKRSARWSGYNAGNGFENWYWQLLTVIYARSSDLLGGAKVVPPVPRSFLE